LDVPEDIEAPLQFFREEQNLLLSSISFSYLNESRNQPTDPTEGFYLSGDLKVSSKAFGSEERFLRFLTQGQYYYQPVPDLTLASSLRLGLIVPWGQDEGEAVDNPIPISERFFAGGRTTLRGLPLDLAGPLLRDPETGEVILVHEGGGDQGELVPVPIGGNALVVANTELRFPMVSRFAGVLFYDVGNVFRSFAQMEPVALSHALGFGLSIRTPVGPVRLDLAYNPAPPAITGFTRWNFHINIGQPF
jgi:outer membrane protein assembly factor BamA